MTWADDIAQPTVRKEQMFEWRDTQSSLSFRKSLCPAQNQASLVFTSWSYQSYFCVLNQTKCHQQLMASSHTGTTQNDHMAFCDELWGFITNRPNTLQILNSSCHASISNSFRPTVDWISDRILVQNSPVSSCCRRPTIQTSRHCCKTALLQYSLRWKQNMWHKKTAVRAHK